MNKRSVLLNPVGFLAIFYYYVGKLSFVVYPYVFIKTRFVLPIFDWLVLLYLVILFCFSVYTSGFVEAAQVYRFHWGFLAFYLFFRNNTDKYNIQALLVVLILLTFFESILVNSLISAESMPNYPSKGASGHFSDSWQRVYGFGGNSSVLSVLLVSLLSIVHTSTTLLFSLFVIILLIGSGSGGFAYISYLLYRLNLKILPVFMVITTITVVAVYFFSDTNFLINVINKTSFEYVNILLELKYSQIIQRTSNMDFYEMLMGTSLSANMGGDFLWLTFFICHGFIGSTLMLVFMLKHINSANRFGLLIIFIMTSHYFVLFSVPGQFIAGYMFALKPKNLGYMQHKMQQ